MDNKQKLRVAYESTVYVWNWETWKRTDQTRSQTHKIPCCEATFMHNAEFKTSSKALLQ